MDLLKLNFQIEQGSEGVDDDPLNPLSRALNRLLADGQPLSNLSICLYGDMASASNRIPNLRWLGAFVFSAGNRVIFFPGFNFPAKSLSSFRGQSHQGDHMFETDHLSLENGFQTWHITSPESSRHMDGGQTIPLGENRFLWLGMSVASDTALRELKRETIIQAQAPSSDIKRRLQVFIQSRCGAEFPCVSLPPGAQASPNENFLYFAFIVGPKGFEPYTGGNLPLPVGSTLLSGPLPEEINQLPLRSHRFSLGPETDIQIVSTCLPGKLKQLVTFTTLSRQKN